MNVFILLCDFMLNCDFFGITLSLSDCSVLGLREQICGAKTIIACGEGSASRMIDVGRG